MQPKIQNGWVFNIYKMADKIRGWQTNDLNSKWSKKVSYVLLFVNPRNLIPLSEWIRQHNKSQNDGQHLNGICMFNLQAHLPSFCEHRRNVKPAYYKISIDIILIHSWSSKVKGINFVRWQWHSQILPGGEPPTLRIRLRGKKGKKIRKKKEKKYRRVRKWSFLAHPRLRM